MVISRGGHGSPALLSVPSFVDVCEPRTRSSLEDPREAFCGQCPIEGGEVGEAVGRSSTRTAEEVGDRHHGDCEESQEPLIPGDDEGDVFYRRLGGILEQIRSLGIAA